ncbi:uncharacterized protein [Argopecten irradians]|uniref:uncharacterized protein n=1 Tax=Argopecten irradians TaxID=31199 RepID=UPI00371C9F40
MNTAICLLLLLNFIAPVQSQSWANRYRNPYIAFSVQRLCWGTTCGGFEQLCDIATFPCLVAPCPKYPMCFQTNGSIQKSGVCPRPWNVLSSDVPCNTDWACADNMICCHGFFGSTCLAGATPALP